MKEKLFVVADKKIDKELFKNFNVIYIGDIVEENKNSLNHNEFCDTDGINIHNKYKLYKDLCGIYYIYKNIEKFAEYDYIGIQINTTLFNFSDTSNSKFAYIENKNVENGIEAITNLKEDTIDNYLKTYDCILPWPTKVTNVYQNYLKNHIIENLGVLMGVLNDFTDNDFNVVKEYIYTKMWFEHNMYIFKKEKFLEFCDYTFPKLFEFEARYIRSYEETHKSIYIVRDMSIYKILNGLYFYKLLKEGTNILFVPLVNVNNQKEKLSETFKRMEIGNYRSVNHVTIRPLIERIIPFNMRINSRYKKANIEINTKGNH
ncbi:MAG: DUF4422 domain-containing protein [Clostridia bacterium]|nr:DUF4422 domain-containing protein [Clostridia bacterium]